MSGIVAILHIVTQLIDFYLSVRLLQLECSGTQMGSITNGGELRLHILKTHYQEIFAFMKINCL